MIVSSGSSLYGTSKWVVAAEKIIKYFIWLAAEAVCFSPGVFVQWDPTFQALLAKLVINCFSLSFNFKQLSKNSQSKKIF